MATLSRTSFPALTRTLPLVGIALLTAPFASGCELFVHFDRTRIGSGDTGVLVDAGSDSATDGGHDAGSDANVDASGPDTGMADGGMDAGNDGGNDAGTDAWRPDTGADAGCVTPSLDCPVPTDECEVAICTGGTCDTMRLGNTHVLSSGQTANDCQQVVCNSAGGTSMIADSADHPASTQCDTITCAGTTVTHTPVSMGMTCSMSGGTVCDGSGACVACNVAGDCTPTGMECRPASCSAHVCGMMQLDNSHTMSTGQMPGNCQRLVCSGTGNGTTNIDDATDLPTSTTACQTTPACTGSPLAPSFTDAATGTDCTADGMPPRHVCGDTSMLTSGMCIECNTTADCAGATTCQTDHTCS